LYLNAGLVFAQGTEDASTLRPAILFNKVPQNFPSLTQFKKPLIVIDPGHGGRDPGAINSSHGIKEKNITLSMAKELKSQLESSGLYNVLLTRTYDKSIELNGRVEFARVNNADLFISLHADSIGKPLVRGVSVYTLSKKASDEQTAKLAAHENSVDVIANLNLGNSEVEDILLDLILRDTMNQSNYLATNVVDALRINGIRMLEKPHRFAGFAVLKIPDIPSVLIEVGFMSNYQEALMLSKAEYRHKIGRAMVASIEVYFKNIRLNHRS